MNTALLFTLRRPNGQAGTTPDTATAKTWAEANRILQQWAQKLSASDDHEEVLFSILFDNGNVYKGRLVLSRRDAGNDQLLAGIINQNLAFRAGLSRPDTMTEEQYRLFLAEIGAEAQLEALNWLRYYFIPDED